MERSDCLSHAWMESIEGLFAGVIQALIDQFIRHIFHV